MSLLDWVRVESVLQTISRAFCHSDRTSHDIIPLSGFVLSLIRDAKIELQGKRADLGRHRLSQPAERSMMDIPTEILTCDRSSLSNCRCHFFEMVCSLLAHVELCRELAEKLTKACWGAFRLSKMISVQTESLKILSILFARNDSGASVNEFVSKVLTVSRLAGRQNSSFRSAILDSFTHMLIERSHFMSNTSIQAINTFLLNCISIGLSETQKQGFYMSLFSAIHSFMGAFPQFDTRSTIFVQTIILLDRSVIATFPRLDSLVYQIRTDFA